MAILLSGAGFAGFSLVVCPEEMKNTAPLEHKLIARVEGQV
jgi:hypothetical protein